VRELTIYGRRIADDEPCYVIAEIGNNHGGDVATAHRLIDLAATAGAHAVKFQRRHNQTLYSRELLDASYDHEHSYGTTYGAHREALELPIEAYPDLIAHAHGRGMACICTAFDEGSADDSRHVGIDAIKVASGGVTDAALLKHVAQLGVPIVVSTGGCRSSDIISAACWVGYYTTNLALLHCTASYPCRFDELNLSYIRELRALFPDIIIGWSGHDSGISMAVLAYAYGARIVEKHFTSNRAQKGTDHAFSLEPDGMRKLCRDLGRCVDATGDGVKRYYDSERKPISKMRRRQTPDGPRITGEVDQ
jgi:sialic acid synthase